MKYILDKKNDQPPGRKSVLGCELFAAVLCARIHVFVAHGRWVLRGTVAAAVAAQIERILRVELSPLQRRYCRWIITRNFAELNKGANGNQASLLNIVVELKKVWPVLLAGSVCRPQQQKGAGAEVCCPAEQLDTVHHPPRWPITRTYSMAARASSSAM